MKSNINIEKILEKVPDYQQFYDTDELNEQSFRLAREYPELVEIKEIGHLETVILRILKDIDPFDNDKISR